MPFVHGVADGAATGVPAEMFAPDRQPWTAPHAASAELLPPLRDALTVGRPIESSVR